MPAINIEAGIKRLNFKISRSWADVGLIVGRKFTEELTDEKWNWPVSPNPRDIQDTGALRSSQAVSTNGLTTTYRWGVNYSLHVHEGYTTKQGFVAPARPWTSSLSTMNVIKIFSAIFRSKT